MITTVLLLIVSIAGIAQDKKAAEQDAYLKTITQRAEKIAVGLGIADGAIKDKVSLVIRDQYSDLNDIYTQRDIEVKAVKEKYTDKTERETALAKINTEVDKQLTKLHGQYLKKLGKHLNEQQIGLVKDGMTYNVLNITYKAYQDQILTLTEAQKKQIWDWLVEAREKAMDAESSDKKHAWFGKYKGKINNYLSAAGYDLKKEGEEWEKRRKAATKGN